MQRSLWGHSGNKRVSVDNILIGSVRVRLIVFALFALPLNWSVGLLRVSAYEGAQFSNLSLPRLSTPSALSSLSPTAGSVAFDAPRDGLPHRSEVEAFARRHWRRPSRRSHSSSSLWSSVWWLNLSESDFEQLTRPQLSPSVFEPEVDDDDLLFRCSAGPDLLFSLQWSVDWWAWTWPFLASWPCPAGCLHITAGYNVGVWGRYPYHVASSICLAAIHSGIIEDALGGLVFVRKFFPQDWSNSPTQTLFPFDSHLGSLSNQVNSFAVPLDLRPVPAGEFNCSFTVAGRGEVISQRRIAPFLPRAGHLHVYPSYFSQVFYSGVIAKNMTFDSPPHFDLIIGGYNDTVYMNDVWLRREVSQYQEPESIGVGVEWEQLSAAPFTPRAYMTHWLVNANLTDTKFTQLYLIVLGGQTSHACGLRELGVCSNEVFILQIDNANRRLPRQAFRWLELTYRAPFTPRCGAFPIGRTLEQMPSLQTILVVGGHLSYSDASCSSPPNHVNEVWMNQPLPVGAVPWSQQWLMHSNAPFSPRSLMVQADFFGFPEGFRSQVSLVGGVRYAGVRWDGALNRSVLTAVEVFADAHTCILGEFDPIQPMYWVCWWQWSGTGAAAAPSGFFPLPIAGGAPRTRTMVSGDYGEFPRVGGYTSEEAIRAWIALQPVTAQSQSCDLPPPSHNFPLTALLIPDGIVDRNRTVLSVPTFNDILQYRFNLSLSFMLNEAEIHSGAYLGSDWITGGMTTASDTPALVTAYKQEWSMALSPADATPYQPQAASCENTTRSAFRFRLRRLDHSASLMAPYFIPPAVEDETDRTWDIARMSPMRMLVSAGRSGSSFTSDWLTIQHSYCLPPTDPSFLLVLGPLVHEDGDWEDMPYSVWTGSVIPMSCRDGYHWTPATDSRELELFCTPDGMWTDLGSQTIPRCVADLNCPSPLVDRGFGYCSDPLAVVEKISLNEATQAGPLTLIDVLINRWGDSDPRPPLLIFGRYFRLPVRVLVGGSDCILPDLLNFTDQLCHNGTSSSSACVSYATTIRCVPPIDMFGLRLPVLVTVGPSATRAVTDDGIIPTLTSTSPTLSSLQSPDCVRSPSNVLELLDCPANRSIVLTVCYLWRSVGSDFTVSIGIGADEILDCHFARFNWGRESVCGSCALSPRVGSKVSVRLNARYNEIELFSQRLASISFQSCDAGYWTDMSSEGRAGSPCQPCDPGYSTNGAPAQLQCSPCRAGTFSNSSASRTCTECSPGDFNQNLNATFCPPCPPNSYTTYPGQTHCNVCDLNHYLVYSGTSPSCYSCPSLASCGSDGNINTTVGAFLLIDQTAGLVQQESCSPLACLSATDPDFCVSSDEALIITQSRLRVRNCCEEGRLPAYSAVVDVDSPLYDTDGVNVLCAWCSPGYSKVSGRCIPCESVQWGSLFGLLVLSLLLVWILHRAPHDFSGSATVMILGYFIQQTSIFLASLSFAQLATVVNVSLESVSSVRGSPYLVAACIVPLSDYGHIGLALTSPLIAVALLALLCGIQLLVRWCLLRYPVGEAQPLQRVYELLFVPSQDALRSEREKLLLLYARTMLRLAQLSYSSIATVCVSYFSSQDVREYGERLTAYTTIDPASAQYRHLLPVIVMVMALFVCGSPLALLAFLYKHHRDGRIASLKQMRQSREKDGDADEQLSMEHVILLQLCAMCDSRRWWYPSFILLRRLVLALFLVFIQSQSVWIWVTLVNYLALAVHLALRPFDRKEDNQLEALCLTSLGLQSILLSIYPPPIHSGLLWIVFAVLLVGPMLPTTLTMAVTVWKRWGWSNRERPMPMQAMGDLQSQGGLPADAFTPLIDNL